MQNAFKRTEDFDSSFANVLPGDSDLGQAKMFEAASTGFRSRRTTRNSVATGMDDVDFTENTARRKKTTGPKVNYVKPVKRAASRRKIKNKIKIDWTWNKIGWLCCLGLLVRIVSMEGGLLDYHTMDNALVEKEAKLVELRTENAEIISQIHKIKTSPRYQKQLAREHLGVIAKDEYLVIFSSDHR